MIRRILVPLDPSPYTATAIQHALTLAQDHGAIVTGQVVLDLPEISAPATMVVDGQYGMFPIDLEQEKLEDAKKRIDELVSSFEEKCASAGVPYRVARMQGVPARKILEVAMFHDLVIMGLNTYFHFETRTAPGHSLDKILTHSAVPVLAVPQEFHELRHALFAFDGSFHAASTMHKLATFAAPLSLKITILAAGGDHEKAEESLARAKEFLQAHGCQDVETQWSIKPILAAVTEDHYEGTNLIAAGVHTRNPMRDFFVGSFTKAMITKGETAMFLGL
jgi:nucleotide-binding universal stress UspA family protein